MLPWITGRCPVRLVKCWNFRHYRVHCLYGRIITGEASWDRGYSCRRAAADSGARTDQFTRRNRERVSFLRIGMRKLSPAASTSPSGWSRPERASQSELSAGVYVTRARGCGRHGLFNVRNAEPRRGQSRRRPSWRGMTLQPALKAVSPHLPILPEHILASGSRTGN